MKINIYSVFDVKSQLYGTPFFMLRDEIAQRAFADLVNDKSTMVSRHPEDFLLYKIGEFWDDSGNVSSTIPLLLWVMLPGTSASRFRFSYPVLWVARLKRS